MHIKALSSLIITNFPSFGEVNKICSSYQVATVRVRTWMSEKSPQTLVVEDADETKHTACYLRCLGGEGNP